VTLPLPPALVFGHVEAILSLFESHAANAILDADPTITRAPLVTEASALKNELGFDSSSLPRSVHFIDIEHESDAVARLSALLSNVNRIRSTARSALADDLTFWFEYTTCGMTCAAQLFDIDDVLAAGQHANHANLNDVPLDRPLSDIAGCTNLRHLALSSHHGALGLPFPVDMRAWPKLEAAQLGENGLEALPAGLTTLSELRYLDLSDNNLYKLRGIEKLQKLRILDLSGNDLAIGEARRISSALPDCIVTV